MSHLPQDFLPDSVDELLQKLASTEREWADLKALHGTFGKYNDIRKAKLAVTALMLRAGEPPKGALKWTDDLLDTAAHADSVYRKFVQDAETDAARFYLLDQQRDAIWLKAKSLTYVPR